ncbi:MAG TPA: nuclease-related domain-containing protein, partial [Pirellulales bacterium]|nr:nuclease-related domain-containing protein [Pirellulales bacterium]
MAKNRYIPDDTPLSIRNDPRFRAEILVYDELKAQLDAAQRDWTVVYQAKWLLKEPGQGEPKEGEADFLLAHPKRGVLAVEVKGGTIIFRDGQWYSRDRNGAEHPIDPFAQVARNARNLAKKF